LSSLPRTADCLVVSDVSAFRGGEYKYTFILDFNEGIIPAAAPFSGVLTNSDAARLKSAGLTFGPDAEALNGLSRAEVEQLMASSQKLFLSYLRDEASRPSPLLYQVRAYPGVFENSYETEREKLEGGATDTDFMAFYASCTAGGLEHLLLTANDPTALTAPLYEILKETADKYLNEGGRREAEGGMKGGDNGNLFFKNGTVSASQLQTYFECPYKHFIKYGLRAGRPETGEITPLDSGAVIHKMSELFVKSGFDEDKLNKILDETPFGYKYELEQNAVYKDKLKKEIKKLCLIFKGQIESGLFKPLGAEIRFGSECGVRNSVLKIDGVNLIGSIDYADEYDGMVRIIDYKSGAADFNKSELYHGIKLQLPLYMGVMLRGGFRPAAMLYFKFKSRWDGDYRFTGVFNNSEEAVNAMDAGFDGTSKVIAAKQKEGKDIGGGGAKTAGEIEALCAYAVDVSTLAVKLIKEGNITPSPFEGGRAACDYCAFAPACGFTGDYRRPLKAPGFDGEDE